MARAKETVVTLMLLSLTILGMMYVIAALIDRDKESLEPLLSESTGEAISQMIS
jgi:hypothetical protein